MQQVQQQVGANHQSGPLPGNPFDPIRAGYVQVKELRVLDRFGQYRDILNSGDDALKMVIPERLKVANPPNTLLFPPRLTQASRLQFQWLSAQHGRVEQNAHAAATPVCGWLLPNHLDHSLVLYDANGGCLGALRAFSGEAPGWIPLPGAEAHCSKNPHMQALISALTTQYSGDQFNQWMDQIEQTLRTIEPPTYRQHDALAVLMGRPLALVRASLKLELKGDPAINQSLATLQQRTTLAHYSDQLAQATNGFTQVEFPLRLGNMEILGDGLVGFYPETGAGDTWYDYNNFKAESASAPSC